MSDTHNTMRPGRKAQLRPEDIAEMRGYLAAFDPPLAELIEAGRRIARLLDQRIASDLAIGADAKPEWYALMAWDAALHNIDPAHPAPLLPPYPDATGLMSTTELYDPWFNAMYTRYNAPPATRAKVVCDMPPPRRLRGAQGTPPNAARW